ncbi:MAG TPA: Crp/Fnr family transcriptional regulator [Candidatus Limnocylindria bacterium]|nr:Crp/Fnr family transcriptional regulator [Candidatus Limnocylindria bacterium]
MNKLWFLRRLDLFEGMTEAEISRVAVLLHERSCRTGADVIVKPTGDRVYLLKSGRVRVTNGDVNVAILGPGQLFGTSALFGAAVTSQKVTAIEDVVICEAAAGEFLRAMTMHPRLAAKVAMLLARQLFELEDTVQRTATDPIEARLADLLLRMADRSVTPSRIRSISQADLARMIGASRESVSRLIAMWERDGLLRTRPRLTELLDEDGLRDRTRAG